MHWLDAFQLYHHQHQSLMHFLNSKMLKFKADMHRSRIQYRHQMSYMTS